MVYGHQILNFSSALTTEFKTNDPTEQVVADCLKNLAGLGEHARALAGGRITTPSQGQAQVHCLRHHFDPLVFVLRQHHHPSAVPCGLCCAARYFALISARSTVLWVSQNGLQGALSGMQVTALPQ